MARSTDPHPAVPAATGPGHVAGMARVQAQKLVEEIGSVGLAKQAVEAVSEAMAAKSNEEKLASLAKALGFDSVASLQPASCPVPANDGSHWFVTKVRDSAWAIWNDQQFEAERLFSDRDEALASVPHDDQFTGSSLLG